ncbi:MAG: glycerol dehydrogenase [Pirellulaceae bacterium]|jgi:glycerol dehydrogenase|nr:glycerol dehydrogenase [Pirellulaceae bacterium]MDP7018423.1 glycerol dehydrogenase [Pirellulaceae bacterium]
MKQTAIFPGRYVQSADALRQLGDELTRLGERTLIVAGNTAAGTIIPALIDSWGSRFEVAVESFGGECSDAEIERLTEIARSTSRDVVVAMGGGKVIDTAKAVGHGAGARVAIAPTIASTDAPTSAVSVIYTEQGAFSRYLFLPHNPDLVLVDTTVIARAPVRFLVAGVGDALATWFEADACRQAFAENQCGGLGTLAAFNLARLCYDTILEFGVAAKMSCEQNVVTPALSHVVEANTLLSGLGFESGGLASAHSIHNGLTRLEGAHDYYHGEKVAIGVLAGLFLADRPTELIDEVYDFCESVGLPTTLADVGVVDPSEEELQLVAEGACAAGETIHHEPSPVSVDAVVAALKTADSIGRRRCDQT